MSFDLDVIIIIRALVDDMAPDDCSSQEYSDERILQLAYVAAAYVNMDLGTEYTVSVSEQTISPDPDSDFINLTALKAACLLIRSQHTSYARSDFRVTDGPATVDVKGAADKLKVAAEEMCSQFQRAKTLYLCGDAGSIISTPNSDTY